MELRELGAGDIREIKELILKIFTVEPWNDTWTEGQLQLYVFELLHNSGPLILGLYEEGS